MRSMGLDVGEKRIGVAMSDPLKKTAHAFAVIERSGLDSTVKTLRDMIEEYDIEEIVVGMPYAMDGSEGPQARKTTTFIEEVKDRLDVSIATWDERLSTAEAERSLIAAGIKPSMRKNIKDKVAAAVILQSYLDRQVKGK